MKQPAEPRCPTVRTEGVSDQGIERESRVAGTRERIVKLCLESTAERGTGRWERDELHER